MKGFSFTIILTFTICSYYARAQALLQSKTIPPITITDLDGNKIDASKLPDGKKIIVLDFWATWCVPCKKELTNLSDIYPDWQKNYNVEIIAVSIDDARNMAKVKTYTDGSNWTYKVLIDANQDLRRALDFQNVPYTILVDQKGTIVYQHEGYVDGDEFLLEEKIKSIAGK